MSSVVQCPHPARTAHIHGNGTISLLAPGQSGWGGDNDTARLQTSWISIVRIIELNTVPGS